MQAIFTTKFHSELIVLLIENPYEFAIYYSYYWYIKRMFLSRDSSHILIQID
jgi:hypothetical protein